MKLLLTLTIILVVFGTAKAFQFDWQQKVRQIELLKSTRTDLIKIFGNPDNETPNLFKIKEAYVSAMFSNGEDCKSGIRWKVPKGVVISFNIFFEKAIAPRSLNVDFKGFTKHKEFDTPNIIYINDKRGITYVTFKGKITAINYDPPEKYDYLICK